MDDNPPRTTADLARQIDELLDRHRLAHARNLLREALASAPDDERLLLLGARADLLEDDHASARQTLERVLARHPGHFMASYMLLNVLTGQGELVEAERLALSLIAVAPQSADLFAAYSRVMLRALLFPKARALAQEALRMDPDNDYAMRMLALCDLIQLRRGTDSAALQRLLADNPEDQSTLSLLVWTLYQQGQRRAALRGARELLRSSPGDPGSLEIVRALSAENHWSMKPLWPLQRFGWAGSMALWLGGVLAVRALSQTQSAAASWLSWSIVGYCVYSWVWPPLFKRFVDRP
jgi:tetratricopeptide (TPR) repeat protein